MLKNWRNATIVRLKSEKRKKPNSAQQRNLKSGRRATLPDLKLFGACFFNFSLNEDARLTNQVTTNNRSERVALRPLFIF
jgi:hypothetical protein